jgi:protein gp37
MGDRTGIQWTEATWNPVVGCSKVSPGCANCYAETFSLTRLKGRPGYTGLPWTPENAAANVQLRPERLDQPLRWQRPRMIFVNSMSDLFHELIHPEYIARVFAVMAATPRHTYQILTKRPERMASLLSDALFWALVADAGAERGLVLPAHLRLDRLALERLPLPNVWLGTSIENDRFSVRADVLRTVPAAVRFISAEPLLGPLPSLDLTDIHWIIFGGESGRKARRLEPLWIRQMLREAHEAGTAIFVKQLGSLWDGKGKGGDMDTWPVDLRIRSYPSPAVQQRSSRTEETP